MASFVSVGCIVFLTGFDRMAYEFFSAFDCGFHGTMCVEICLIEHAIRTVHQRLPAGFLTQIFKQQVTTHYEEGRVGCQRFYGCVNSRRGQPYCIISNRFRNGV